MHKKHLLIIAGIFGICVAMIYSVACVFGPTSTETTPTVEIIYTGAGTMPGLLATGNIDGYIIWQPFVAVGVEGCIGKVISYSQDLPPKDMWKQHPCCVIGANSRALANTDLTASIIALVILGNKYINDYPEKSAELTADWLFSKQNMRYGNVSVSSVTTINASIPTIRFSSEITDAWLLSNEDFLKSQRDLKLLTGNLAFTSTSESQNLLYDFGPYEIATAQIASEKLIPPSLITTHIAIGYLPSDHDSTLFVLLKDWQYFKETYNSYLKPNTDKAGKISEAELFISGEKIADVTFVEGSEGPQLMTLLSQNTIQYAIAGISPYLNAIDKSTGITSLKILAPIQLEGSGLIVSLNSPANDWEGFIHWIIDRSATGNNIIIADPQLGSIQDVQLKTALKESGITVVTVKQ
ncbi:MAG TPA: ABC transporter substrate-binding protein [Methanocorpusculum sp.]|nr:ABC transporter substrate-binding protein [Methanocorpusculum sp.]